MPITQNATVLVVILTALAVSGCSTSKSTEAGNSSAGDYTYCGALTATCNSFYAGTPTACSQAARDQCSTYQPAYSQGFQDAVVSCGKSFSPCIKDFYDCIADRTSTAAPTTAQAKVKADFCVACPDKTGAGTVGPCSTFFSKNADAGPGVYGLGVPVLKVNDTIAAEIGLKCIGASSPSDGGVASAGDGGSDAGGSSGGCDPFAFAICANTVVQVRTTPAACQADGG
jgi:hypothetical protein